MFKDFTDSTQLGHKSSHSSPSINDLCYWELLEPKGRLTSDQQAELNRARAELAERWREVGGEAGRIIERFKHERPFAWRYLRLFVDFHNHNNPEFMNDIRKHAVSVAGYKGFRGVYILSKLLEGQTPVWVLCCRGLGELPEEELKLLIGEAGHRLPTELEKIPLRLWDKVKVEAARIREEEKEETELLRTMKEAQEIEGSVYFEGNEDIEDAVRLYLTEEECEILELVDVDKKTFAEVGATIGFTRDGAYKRYRKARKRLLDLASILNNS